jgi:methionyl-tRNA formyltransferase
MSYFNLDWIIFFGGPGRELVVEKLLKKGVNIKLILIPENIKKKLESSINFFISNNIPIALIQKSEIIDSLKGINSTVFLSIGFPYIIPSSVYKKQHLSLNIHPTLLPKYRGGTSGAQVLINGEKETGSTIHLLSDEYDTGPIIMQSKIKVSDFDTIRSIQKKVYKSEPKLLIDSIVRLDKGIKPIPQKITDLCSPVNRNPADSEVDPNNKLIDLINSIRACDPKEYPAFFYYKGEKVCIKLWRPNKKENNDEL